MPPSILRGNAIDSEDTRPARNAGRTPPLLLFSRAVAAASVLNSLIMRTDSTE